MLVLLLSTVVAVPMLVNAAAQGSVVELWSNPMEVDDLAVSKDGFYVAAVNMTGLYFFASHSPSPRWWYLTTWETTGEKFMSVAVSGDGSYVVVGNNTLGSVYYFDKGTTRTGLQAAGTWKWVSKHFPTSGGNSDVERRTIDISDDGQFVVVGGTGSDVYYFFGCTSRSGIGNSWDWSSGVIALVHAVDMSPNGKYVAAGGVSPGLVAFYADANIPGGASRSPTWISTKDIENIMDIAVSDDGYAVAAVSGSVPGTLHYWANAKGLTGTPLNTWNRTYPFRCVDISSKGDSVVTGSQVEASLHYWKGAGSLAGLDIPETWTRLDGNSIADVGINDEGTIIAAVIPYGAGQGVYFYRSSGDEIGHFSTDSSLDKLSMSGNGGITAAGGGGTRSLHVFEIPIPVGGAVLIPNILGTLVPVLTVLVALAGTIGSLVLRRKKTF
jgi:WD40 repeat protein